jgi:sugar/nucleoside kinase (ribokinase family)
VVIEQVVSDKTIDVVCIGNAIVDVIGHADDSFLTDHQMVKGSMQLIDDTLAHKLYADMPSAIESSGGCAANTASGLASFGATVAFVGKVADDQLGEVFTHDIRAAGVRYDPPPVDPGHATARCLILVTPDAERTLNTFLGVSSLIGPSDIDTEMIGRAQVVYCEGYLWDLPAAKEALLEAMAAARGGGGKVAFSLSDSFCVERHRHEFLDLVRDRVDILFANEDEILSLYETDSFDAAAVRVARDAEIACLTRGAKGSTIVTAGGAQTHIEADPATVIDTTGAGDLYAAGFLYGYTHGHDLVASARYGSMAAAEIIGHLGARPEVSLSGLAAGRG